VSIATLTKAALTRLRGDLDSPVFTWKGVEVPCVPNTLGVGSIIAAGGFEMTVGLSLYVDRDEFFSVDSTLVSVDSELYTSDNDLPTPMSGKTVIYHGATYRIGTARFSPCQTFLVLLMGDANA
jgi:hypothetical protein